MLMEFGTDDIKLQTFQLPLNHNIHKNRTNITSNKYSSQSHMYSLTMTEQCFIIAREVFWSSMGHTSIHPKIRTPAEIVFEQVHILLPRSYYFY